MRFRALGLIVLLGMAVLSACSSAPPINVTGTWEGSITGPGGTIGYRLVLTDNRGALSGEAYMLDATYGFWRDVGPVSGTRVNTNANMTNYFSDGSGYMTLDGEFKGASFTGNANVYDDNGQYLGSLSVALTKK